MRGFTLMEILVALTILAIAFTAIFKAVSSQTRGLLYLQNKTAAEWVALNVIAEKQLNLLSETSGTEKMFNTIWHWCITTQPTAYHGITLINVAVSQTEESNSIVHVTGYLKDDIA